MEEKKEIFLKEYAKNLNVTNACEKSGIPRSTLYSLKKKNKDFKERFDAIEETMCDIAESVLYRTLKNSVIRDDFGVPIKDDEGDYVSDKNAIDCAKFILARKGKSRGYGETLNLTAEINASKNILESQAFDAEIITAEEIKRLAMSKVKS
jgi:hypothetical protein